MATVLSPVAAAETSQIIQSIASTTDRPANWLVIADNDSELQDQLQPVLENRPAIVLKSAQDSWDFQQTEFVKKIEWAFNHGEIKSVILVGRSETPGELSAGDSQSGADDVQGGYQTLVAGVQQTIAANRDAEDRFATHAKALSQVSAIITRLSHQSIALHALLYRGDGSGFAKYSFESGTYSCQLS